MTTAECPLGDMDDVLGPRDHRFFSEGYKRVKLQVTGINISGGPDNTGEIQGVVGMTYPADWSRKSTGVALRPHLSSIDSLLAGVQLAEAYLTHAYRLDSDQRRRMWLRRFAMRAGNLPQEELACFGASARHAAITPADDTLCGHISVFDCRIGTVKIRAEVEHGVTGDSAPSNGTYETIEEVLGPAEDRYYGTGYKSRQHFISDVRFSPRHQRLHALVSVSDADALAAASDGLGGHYQPALSMIDSMAVMAQIGQVLMYQQDGIDRSLSNTLWMRKVTMECKTPYQPVVNAFIVSGMVIRSDLLPVGTETWRVSKMVGDCQGIRAETSLSHQIPAVTPAIAANL